MAEILLRFRECEEGDLPRVCAVCGEGDAEFVDTTLRSLIARGPDSATYRVVDSSLPLCDRHSNHFRRPLFIALGAVGCLAVVFIGVISSFVMLIGVLHDKIFVFAPIALVVCLGAMIGMVVAIVLANRGQVRARAINERGVIVVNVAAKFVKAVKEFRVTGRLDDDEDDDDDDDDEPLKRRRRR